MSTKPFPQRPNLEFDRKQARKLLQDFRARDPDAIARFEVPVMEEMHEVGGDVGPATLPMPVP